MTSAISSKRLRRTFRRVSIKVRPRSARAQRRNPACAAPLFADTPCTTGRNAHGASARSSNHFHRVSFLAFARRSFRRRARVSLIRRRPSKIMTNSATPAVRTRARAANRGTMRPKRIASCVLAALGLVACSRARAMAGAALAALQGRIAALEQRKTSSPTRMTSNAFAAFGYYFDRGLG